MKITVYKESIQPLVYCADDMSRPGSPPVGRGSTIKEAIGDYFLQNQTEYKFEFDLDRRHR